MTGLEAFERIKKHHEIWETEDVAIYGTHSYATGEYEQEEELNAVEKELKALRILKSVSPDLARDLLSFLTDKTNKDANFYDFIGWVGDETDVRIKEDDFDVLKEALL